MFFAHDTSLNVCQLQHNKCVVKSPCDLYCVVPFNFFELLQCEEFPRGWEVFWDVVCYVFHWYAL